MSSSDDGIRTPTSTCTSFSWDGAATPTSSECEKPSWTGYLSSIPRAGRTYKIHQRNTDKVITLVQGDVLLRSATGPPEPGWGGCPYWDCTEKGNWMGFRNPVSGNFLACNRNLAGFHCQAMQRDSSAHFCFRPHPNGGYILLVKDGKVDELRQVGCSSDGKTLIGKEKDGVQWEFEEMQMTLY